MRNNTPIRGTGLTPRDFDKKWSLATPLLERELVAAEDGESVSMDTLVKETFQNWRLMRALVVQRL